MRLDRRRVVEISFTYKFRNWDDCRPAMEIVLSSLETRNPNGLDEKDEEGWLRTEERANQERWLRRNEVR